MLGGEYIDVIIFSLVFYILETSRDRKEKKIFSFPRGCQALQNTNADF